MLYEGDVFVQPYEPTPERNLKVEQQERRETEEMRWLQ
jgi:hypothetical protein